MIHKFFAVYDAKVATYMQPFSFTTQGAAMRAFTDLVNSNDNAISKHPEDYSLFELSQFDDQTGLFEPLTAPLCLTTALQVKVEA